MQISGPTKLVKTLVFLLSTFMFLTIVVPTQTAEASSASGSPCPQYSVQDVFADPKGNWDGDLVNNADELYNGLNPCVVDTSEYCANGGNPLCIYPVQTYVTYSSACRTSVNSYPNADYDSDGITNATEVRNGANPCTHPCPNPLNVDLALNPNGSWDSDGISNALEVADGTNPCDGYRYNPCPRYSTYQINYMPGLDWDGDGQTNSAEHQRGTNPCIYNSAPRLTHVTQQQNRLPHVNTSTTSTTVTTTTTTTITIVPKLPAPVCPVNYPYYHRGNGLCYANPIGHHYWY